MADNQKKIPCTVAVLTHNSERTLARALESVKDFAELIVCDGASTDRTLDIARAYGARIIPQDTAFQDREGRISDFGSVRNQTLKTSTQDWFFFLDSDEALTSELVAEIRLIVAGNKPACFWISRKYEIEGKVIDCAATYPARQMRLFHKSAVTGFIKPIHEKINPKPGAVIKNTGHFMLVPVSPDPRAWREKWKHYIELEVVRRGKISSGQWFGICFKNLQVSLLYLFRFKWNLIFCRGTRMPWRLEWERHVYHWNLCRALRRNLYS